MGLWIALLVAGLLATAIFVFLRAPVPSGAMLLPQPSPAEGGERSVVRGPAEQAEEPTQVEPAATPESAPAPRPERTPIAPDPRGSFAIEPPGTVLIAGGPTWIGSEPDEIEALLLAEPTLRPSFAALQGETPRHLVDLPSFRLMVNEVTLEQYERFVLATKRRAPLNWGRAAIDAAREEFLAEDARRRVRALAEGQPPPARRTFSDRDWWLENGAGLAWSLSEEADLSVPVTHVDLADAQAYANWAGLRLMSEQEYQRACRGATTRPWPWGEDWDEPARAATAEFKVNAALPAGSFESGASQDGCFDLAGNVWEWTASVYLPYPDFEPMLLQLGEERLDAQPDFAQAKHVAVGGSYQTTRWAARCAVRRGTSSGQVTNALGFRCAASLVAGRDRLAYELGRIEAGSIAGSYELTASAGLDRWLATEPPLRPAGYAVIAEYEYIAFAPAVLGEEGPRSGLDSAQFPRCADVGVLSTNLALLDPPLGTGIWFAVLCRAEGRVDEPRWLSLLECLRAREDFDEARPALALLSPAGGIAAVLPAEVAWTGARRPPALEPAGAGEVRLQATAFFAAGRAQTIECTLGFDPAALAGPWRR